MKKENSQLVNTHWLPINVYRYEEENENQVVAGHSINAVFQTDTGEVAFDDLTEYSQVVDLRTIVWK